MTRHLRSSASARSVFSPLRPNEMHEMHFISRAKYILCATFCEFGRMALHEVHFMYHILAIRTKKPVFHEMKYTKCASCPCFYAAPAK